MKGLVCLKPRQFEYRDISLQPLKKDHALLRIRRVGICGTDLHAFEGTQPYFSYPRILGHELAGDVCDWNGAEPAKEGVRATIIPYFNCGTCIACRNGKPNCCATLNVCGVHSDGGMVAFLQVPLDKLITSDLSYEELALVEPLAIGAHGIRRAQIQRGEFVLVVGAGPIGLGLMEFARIAGAQVIGMDINEDRLAFCRSQLRVPFTVNASLPGTMSAIRDITNGDMPTVVIDATGNLGAIEKGFELMAHGGRYVLVGLQRDRIGVLHPEFHKREATLMSSRNAAREDFVHVLNAMRDGLISPTTYITHRVSFDDLGERFPSFLDPKSGVIKAMAEFS
ncbi:MAG TPA: zinc-binding alcohol dehydrogenase family protein [Chryseolinea sp.]|nr:zinc-binding alcohol dehydrogenase family protein [Chryseolinea sp.]